MWDFALPGAVDTAVSLKRGILPPKKLIEYQEAMTPGATAAAQNAPRGTTNKEAQFAKDVIHQEDEFIAANPVSGIDPNDPAAFSKYREKLKALKENARKGKEEALRAADASGETLSMGKDELAHYGAARGSSEESMAMANAELDRAFSKEVPYDPAVHGRDAKTYVSNNRVYVKEPVSLTPTEAQAYIRDLDKRITELGGYDDLLRSKGGVDPSAMEKVKTELDALRLLRQAATEKVVATADKVRPGVVAPANARMSSMIEYEGLADRFDTETLQGMTPGSGRSMTDLSPSAPRSVAGLVDTALGGAVSDANDARRRASNLNRGGEAVKKLQNIIGYRTGALKKPKDIGGSFQGGNAATLLRQVPTIGRVLANDAEAQSLFPEPQPFQNGIPRDTTTIDQNAIAHFLMKTSQSPKAQIAQGLAAKLEEANRAQDKSKAERIVSDMAYLFPEEFEPGTGVNGKLYHPIQQKEYMDVLKKAHRNGVVDSIFLAKQKNAFNDPMDARILPVDREVQKRMFNEGMNKRPQNGKPREYGY
jgi:hypothetical protein